MPTPTPQQLQEAKRRRVEERRISEEMEAKEIANKREQVRKDLQEQKRRQRDEWLKRRERLLPKIARYDQLSQNISQIKVLDSVLTGYYDEMDKLCKKVPAEQITELFLGKVNKVIHQAKEMLVGDDFIDSTEIFVPAGSRPEHRDVLLVLRELRQGISRAKEDYTSYGDNYNKYGWREYREIASWTDEVTDAEIDEEIEKQSKPSRTIIAIDSFPEIVRGNSRLSY